MSHHCYEDGVVDGPEPMLPPPPRYNRHLDALAAVIAMAGYNSHRPEAVGFHGTIVDVNWYCRKTGQCVASWSSDEGWQTNFGSDTETLLTRLMAEIREDLS